MQDVRRVILYLSAVIGVWALVSFGGAMFDSANAAFWADSLLWSLLSCLIVMPALLMVSHASTNTKQDAEPTNQQEPTPTNEQEPFVQDSPTEIRTLWPEPEQSSEWPPDDVVQEQKHSQRETRADA